MEYKIKPIKIKASGAEDVVFPHLKDRVIEKSGATISFTMKEVEENTLHLEQKKKEIEPLIVNSQAKIDNVEKFHPIVKTLTGEQLIAAHIYVEAKEVVDTGEAKLLEINKILRVGALEVEEIKKQIPEFVALEEAEAKDAADAKALAEKSAAAEVQVCGKCEKEIETDKGHTMTGGTVGLVRYCNECFKENTDKINALDEAKLEKDNGKETKK